MTAAVSLPTTPSPTPSTGRSRLYAVPPAAPDLTGRARAMGVDVTGVLAHGDLLVDLDSYTVTVAGEPVLLSARQVELLALFLAAPQRVWSRDQLHWLCWGDTLPSRRVDVQLCRLRGRTGLDLFRNVRDRGWALRAV